MYGHKKTADQSHKYRDPLNIDNMRHKYLRSPYDKYDDRVPHHHTMKTQYRDSSYWYQNQLLNIEKASLEEQLTRERINNRQSFWTIQDLISQKKKYEVQSQKNLLTKRNNLNKNSKSANKSENDKKYTYTEQKIINGQNVQTRSKAQTKKQQRVYQDVYKPAINQLAMVQSIQKQENSNNLNRKLSNSLLSSPNREVNNIGNELEYTSNTKAAIFRRLYDEQKTRKLKIHDQINPSNNALNKNKSNIILNHSSTTKLTNDNLVESNEESQSQQVANYLEEISFLKTQLQEKNKIIVDMQCELIRKSAKKQRHQNGFIISTSLHKSQRDKSSPHKNQISAAITRVKQFDIFSKIFDLSIINHSSTLKTIGKVNQDLVDQQSQTYKFTHERSLSVNKVDGDLAVQPSLSSIKLSQIHLHPKKLKFTLEKTQAQQIDPISIKQIGTQTEKLSYKQQLHQLSSNLLQHKVINKQIQYEGQAVQTDLSQLNSEFKDQQVQTSDNLYDYIEQTYLEWVFERDYRLLKEKREKSVKKQIPLQQ